MRVRSLGHGAWSVVPFALRSGVGAALLALALAPTGTVYGQTTYTVNSAADAVDANLLDPACDAGGGQCTLRAAVQQANATPGDDTIVFDAALNGVPITLTIPPVDGCPPFGCFNDGDATAGDLDIFDNLSIIGNGAGNTIVQAGTTLATAVDGIFEATSPCRRCLTTSFLRPDPPERTGPVGRARRALGQRQGRGHHRHRQRHQRQREQRHLHELCGAAPRGPGDLCPEPRRAWRRPSVLRVHVVDRRLQQHVRGQRGRRRRGRRAGRRPLHRRRRGRREHAEDRQLHVQWQRRRRGVRDLQLRRAPPPSRRHRGQQLPARLRPGGAGGLRGRRGRGDDVPAELGRRQPSGSDQLPDHSQRVRHRVLHIRGL